MGQDIHNHGNYNHGIRIFGNGKNRGLKEIEGVRDCCRNYWANFELIGVARFLHCNIIYDLIL